MQNKKSLLRNRFKLKREGPKNKLHIVHQVNNTIGKSEPVVTFPELNNTETELQINSTRFPRPKKHEKNTYIPQNKCNYMDNMYNLIKKLDTNNQDEETEKLDNAYRYQKMMDNRQQDLRKRQKRIKQEEILNLGKNNTVQIQNTKVKIDVGPTMIAKFKHNGKLGKALIDTGANHTLVKQSMLSNNMNIQPTEITMSTCNGTTSSNILGITIVHIKMFTTNNKMVNISIKALVCKELNNHDMIIGTDILFKKLKSTIMQNKWMFDIKKTLCTIQLHEADDYDETYINYSNITIKPYEQKICQVTNLSKSDQTGTLTEIIPQSINGIDICPTIDKVQKTNNGHTINILLYNDSNDTKQVQSRSLIIKPIKHKSVTINSTIFDKIKNMSERQKEQEVNNYLRNPEQIIDNATNTAQNIKPGKSTTTHTLRDKFLETDITNATILDNDDFFDNTEINLNHVDATEKEHYKKLLKKFENVFAKHKYDVPETNMMEHEILTYADPPSQKQRYLAPNNLLLVQKEIDLLEKYDIIQQEDDARHLSNLVIVSKAAARTQADKLNKTEKEHKIRLCQDLRDLNKCTIGQTTCSLPLLEDILQKMQNKIVSAFDQNSGYWSIR